MSLRSKRGPPVPLTLHEREQTSLRTPPPTLHASPSSSCEPSPNEDVKAGVAVTQRHIQLLGLSERLRTFHLATPSNPRDQLPSDTSAADDSDSDSGSNGGFSRRAKVDAPISPGGFNTSLPVLPRAAITPPASFAKDVIGLRRNIGLTWGRADPPIIDHYASGGGGETNLLISPPTSARSPSAALAPDVSPTVGITAASPLSLATPPTTLQPGSIVSFSFNCSNLLNMAPRAARAQDQARTFAATQFLGLVFAVNAVDEPEPRTHGPVRDAVHGNGDDEERQPYSLPRPQQEVFVAFISRAGPISQAEITRCAPLLPKATHCIPLNSIHAVTPGTAAATNPRAPLNSRVKFPWRDYVVWTTVGVRARLETFQPIRGQPIVLVPEDFERFRTALAEDLQAQIRAHEEAGLSRGHAFAPTKYSGHHTIPVEASIDVSLDVTKAGHSLVSPSAWYAAEEVVRGWVA